MSSKDFSCHSYFNFLKCWLLCVLLTRLLKLFNLHPWFLPGYSSACDFGIYLQPYEQLALTERNLVQNGMWTSAYFASSFFIWAGCWY